MYAGGATMVPAGMENIVDWINKQVNNKLAQFDILQYLSASGVNVTGGPALVSAVNVTNETVPANVTEVVVIAAPASLFNVSEYVASSTCQIQAGAQGETAANDTLCCNSPSASAE